MTPLTRSIARPPAACWRRFADVESLGAWVPNLRRVRVITRGADGRPHEVAFELESSSYTLLYSYDEAALRVSWTPRTGGRDAVRGEASFAPAEGGCVMTYQLEGARPVAEPETMVAAFVHWMLQTPA